MSLSFDCVFYYVSDLSRSIRFYRDLLGFRLVSQDAVARFDVNGVLFELVPTADPSRLGTPSGLALKVDDMEAAVAELGSRGINAATPESKEGGILSFFEDPDGNTICLWQYVRR